MDALNLPFESRSLDVVVLFEALYYLTDVPRFLAEAHRVLRPGGALLISTVNCEWGGFHPSFLHTRYWTALELLHALEHKGFETRLFAGFPERDRGGRELRTWLKALASCLGYIPRSMRAKAILKRIFYGRLDRIPPRLDTEGPSSHESAEPMISVESGTGFDSLPNAVFRSPELPMTPALAARHSLFFRIRRRSCRKKRI